MNNSINLTLDEQFDKDCKVIKLKYEYPGYTGEEKWAIITGLTEEELNEKYAEKTASLRPFIVLDLAFGKARTKFINNENKHYMRGVRSIEPFDYDDELLTAHHPELVVARQSSLDARVGDGDCEELVALRIHLRAELRDLVWNLRRRCGDAPHLDRLG